MVSEDELWALVQEESQGVLATVARDGRPQLSNVLYLTDPRSRVVRISTTAGRVKARNLARDPRAALHVTDRDFWQYAVAEGTTTLSAVAATSGDEACRSCGRFTRLLRRARPSRLRPGNDHERAP